MDGLKGFRRQITKCLEKKAYVLIMARYQFSLNRWSSLHRCHSEPKYFCDGIDVKKMHISFKLFYMQKKLLVQSQEDVEIPTVNATDREFDSYLRIFFYFNFLALVARRAFRIPRFSAYPPPPPAMCRIQHKVKKMHN